MALILPQSRRWLNRRSPLLQGGRLTWFPLDGVGVGTGDTGGNVSIAAPGYAYEAMPMASVGLRLPGGGSAGDFSTGLTAASLGISGAAPRTVFVGFSQPDQNAGVHLFGSGAAATRQDFSLVFSAYRTVRVNVWGDDHTFSYDPLGDTPGSVGYGAPVFARMAITYDGGTNLRAYCWLQNANNNATGFVTRARTLGGALNTADTAFQVAKWHFNTPSGNTPGTVSYALHFLGVLGGRVWSEDEAYAWLRDPGMLWRETPAYVLQSLGEGEPPGPPPPGPFDVTLRNPGAGFNVRFDDAPAGETFTETVAVALGAVTSGSPVVQAAASGGAGFWIAHGGAAEASVMALRVEPLLPDAGGVASAVILTVTAEGIVAAEAAGLAADASAGGAVVISAVASGHEAVEGGPQTFGEVGSVPIVFVVGATASVRAGPAAIIAIGPAAASVVMVEARAVGQQPVGPGAVGTPQALAVGQAEQLVGASASSAAMAAGRPVGSQPVGIAASASGQVAALGIGAQAMPLVVTWSDSASAGPMTVVEVGSVGFEIALAGAATSTARASWQQAIWPQGSGPPTARAAEGQAEAVGAAGQGAPLVSAAASAGVGVPFGAIGLPAANVAALVGVSWGAAGTGSAAMRVVEVATQGVGISSDGAGALRVLMLAVQGIVSVAAEQSVAVAAALLDEGVVLAVTGISVATEPNQLPIHGFGVISAISPGRAITIGGGFGQITDQPQGSGNAWRS